VRVSFPSHTRIYQVLNDLAWAGIEFQSNKILIEYIHPKPAHPNNSMSFLYAFWCLFSWQPSWKAVQTKQSTSFRIYNLDVRPLYFPHRKSYLFWVSFSLPCMLNLPNIKLMISVNLVTSNDDVSYGGEDPSVCDPIYIYPWRNGAGLNVVFTGCFQHTNWNDLWSVMNEHL